MDIVQLLQTLATLQTATNQAATPTKPANNRGNFDFDTFNKLKFQMSGGLKVFIALQLSSEVRDMLVKVNSPLQKDAGDIVDLISDFRAKYQAAAAARQNPSERNASVDNAGLYEGRVNTDGQYRELAKLYHQGIFTKEEYLAKLNFLQQMQVQREKEDGFNTKATDTTVDKVQKAVDTINNKDASGDDKEIANEILANAKLRTGTKG